MIARREPGAQNTRHQRIKNPIGLRPDRRGQWLLLRVCVIHVAFSAGAGGAHCQKSEAMSVPERQKTRGSYRRFFPGACEHVFSIEDLPRCLGRFLIDFRDF